MKHGLFDKNEFFSLCILMLVTYPVSGYKGILIDPLILEGMDRVLLPADKSALTMEDQPNEEANNRAVWLSHVTSFTDAPLSSRVCYEYHKNLL